MSKNKEPNDYEVGYGKPPKATQFKKGTSGNPRGRPRKGRGRRDIAKRVLSEKQRLAGQPRGARVLYTALELIIMTLKQCAAAGQIQSARFYTRVLEKYGTPQPPPGDVGHLVVPERLTEEEWEARYSPKDVEQNESER